MSGIKEDKGYVYNNFIYKFVYRDNIEYLLQNCYSTDESICNQYRSIINYLDESKGFKFYFKRQTKAQNAKEILISYMNNNTNTNLLVFANTLPFKKGDVSIRKMLSDLFVSCINNASLESIKNGKKTFLTKFINYIADPSNNPLMKKYLVSLTFDFLY